VDGHDFVKAAFANGACAALVDKDMPEDMTVLDLRSDHFNSPAALPSLPFCLRVDDTLKALQTMAAHWRKQHDIRAIGITGSVGKTSTKELTAAVLSKQYHVLKNPGNLNNEIGLPLTLLSLDAQHEVAVLEMGFYVPGEIRMLCRIANPQIGILTNIGTVHAARAGSIEAIARGKAELVEELPPENSLAILNYDDPRVRNMAQKTKAPVLFYGLDPAADLTADHVQSHGLQGMSCRLHYQEESHTIHSPLLGEFSVYTLLRAAAAGLATGIAWETIENALASSQVDLRMQQKTLKNGVRLLDDTYNASPASTIAALNLLKKLTGRRVAILGDMLELGIYEEEGHQSVGEHLAHSADLAILVGERAKMIAEAACRQGFKESNLYHFPDSLTAAAPARDLIKKGDIVLIKGSNSMQMDRITAALEESTHG
jgi:UDP-N-acetylmuramoyl-tripeptide--D-alanyl-D-alanine ligase